MPRFAIVLSPLLLAVTCLSAHAGPWPTHVVTRFDDPTPNGCLVGDCSLREAVAAATNHYTSDIVQLAAGTYTLDSTLVVRNDVLIYGVGADSTRIVTSVPLNPALKIDESDNNRDTHNLPLEETTTGTPTLLAGITRRQNREPGHPQFGPKSPDCRIRRRRGS